MASIAAALFILPFFLFSALAGQIADRFEKSQLVRIIKIIEILIMIFCFIGFHSKNVSLLLTLLFLMGMHSTFFGPLKYSLLPEHLHSNELVAGNGWIEGGTFLAILTGTILGGILIRLDRGVEIISLAVIFFAVVGYLGSRAIPKSEVADPSLKISFNIFSQTLSIIKYARSKNRVWLSIIGISWMWSIGATYLSQFPYYTKNLIHGDEYIVSFFLAIFSIGIAVGSIICNKILKGKIDARLVPLGSIGITVGIIIFCAASYVYKTSLSIDHLMGFSEFFRLSIYSWIITFGLLVISIFSGIYIVPLYAIMQQSSDRKFLSRVIATTNILNALFMVGSSIAVIILLKFKLDLLQIFLLIAVVNIFVFLLIRKLLKK